MRNGIYDLEYSLVGAFLNGGLSPQAREVMSWLEPEMFATFQLGELYGNIRKQARKDDLIDILLLAQDYGENFANLAELAGGYAYSGNILGYAKKVHSAWVNRTVQQALLKMAGELANAKEEQVSQITQNALNQIQKLLVSKTEIKPIAMGELVDAYVDVLEKRSKSDFKERLLYTGIEAVDNILGGINSTDIVIVAGRPGTGKTEFSLTVTHNIAKNHGSVLFFSLEMGNFQLVDRLLSATGGVSVKKLRNPAELDEGDYHRLTSALQEVRSQDVYFVDRGGLSADEICAITENHISEKGAPSAIVIDYLGLMNHKQERGVNLTQAIANSMGKLKTFAKNFNIPIILLCQLNRDVDSRAVKRPANSDLRDSGSIEQDASQIIMLYREGAYKADCDNPYSEAIVTKNRFGGLGTAYMKFDRGHFLDCDQAQAYQFINEKPQQQAKTYAAKSYGKGALQ
ncbi:TPA: DnaB-like helicase C-terminal domain-containing protein [Haemophilus influenzae]|uniref:replicative DNA helicase n=2 Tax=Haemophilus influenzae TaxID=727 RepID=UPI0001A3F766|nr:replicative DNA helicase [Haemophilus influenzae]AKA46354.1 DNA helicase [Haemophilus influenzae 2019]AWP53629.1 DNA helicase [Haemophilus influenzae]AWP55909.1 DNA helicase [Haemophilus influenzae]EEP48422.1 putative replicative DNA helicase [Haemophilus influenzae 6P18H1]KKZ20637.1 DNA helicase [Haemophilus influenzae 2019]